MAASFIKKSDGNFYLRLTNNTTNVRFGAVSEANATFKFYINGNLIVDKALPDSGSTYYTQSATPIPNNGVLDSTASRYPGAETTYTFPGSGIRDDLLSYTTSVTGVNNFYLGGTLLTWGTNLYSYPGSGYLETNFGVGVKVNGNWNNADVVYVKDNNIWKQCAKMFIKQDGIWKQENQSNGDSLWINVLTGIDDAIDLAVIVIGLN